jgi:tyrosyl-tRNA synthetase
MPEDAVEATVSIGVKLADVLVTKGVVASKGEFRRLVEGRGVSEFGSDTPISDSEYKIEKDMNLRIGKKRFIKIKML